MTRQQAIELARKHAAKAPHTYTKSEAFMPHEWVIDAIMEAHENGADEHEDILEAFKRPPGPVHRPFK